MGGGNLCRRSGAHGGHADDGADATTRDLAIKWWNRVGGISDRSPARRRATTPRHDILGSSALLVKGDREPQPVVADQRRSLRRLASFTKSAGEPTSLTHICSHAGRGHERSDAIPGRYPPISSNDGRTTRTPNTGQ